jgi:CubicO group peptidase (beta-lactamase class C family)
MQALLSELLTGDNAVGLDTRAPLGLEATTFEPDASGVFVGSSFIYAPARDWARFGYLRINDGQINGQRLLERDWPALPASAYAMQGNRSQVVMMLPSLGGDSAPRLERRGVSDQCELRAHRGGS